MENNSQIINELSIKNGTVTMHNQQKPPEPNDSGGFEVVEMRGIEPLSEGNLEGTSPGAVCYLHSLRPAGTNTLRPSVAS